MRHLVNFGLLACFLTLATSGVLAFVRPFSLVTTRVHIVFGLATLILVGLHLSSRLGYFKKQIASSPRARLPRRILLGVVGAWAVLLASAWLDWQPVGSLIGQGYESRHRAEIVRMSPLTGFLDTTTATSRLIARSPDLEADVELSLVIGFARDLESLPAVAVWAESTSGAMIETLYIDPELAYSDQPVWGGQETPRNHIFPLWRNRYTMVSGVDASGEVDALSGATKSHSFSLNNYLRLGEDQSFVVCVEINAPRDGNEAYPDPQIGQPSLLYTALIEMDAEQPYALLELTGHGGGAERNGTIQYDLEGMSDAKNLVDLLLAKATPVAAPQAP